MDHDSLERLREHSAAWRVLRADNALLILSFLGSFFVDDNRGAAPVSQIAAALDDHLYDLNTRVDLGRTGEAAADRAPLRYPKEATSYLDDWAAAGMLRRFYPQQLEEVHFEVTPAFEKAYQWVNSLLTRPFVGTESRLHTVVELLRQIAHGTETDPQTRLAELHRRRAEIDAEIASVEAGDVAILDETGIRDRYQQLSTTARDLLADFREVEANFRQLDRSAREKIAAWDGAKGELLGDLIGTRSQIAGSDQGRSFQAFYDFLLSHARQEELADLLAKVSTLDSIVVEPRIQTIHHDWSEAAERTQRTVRQISDQLRRFLDDQVWLENRRVLDLVREIESLALAAREDPPAAGIEIDLPGIEIALPFERPLYKVPAPVTVDSHVEGAKQAADADALFTQTYIDQARLVANIRGLLSPRTEADLTDVVSLYPIEQGAAEIVGYLAITDDEVSVEMDESERSVLEYRDPNRPDGTKRARLPRVTVKRG
ncbi:DUF3375 domain-containing protein [Rarobacter incanus]|nr:DUF3375 domain-containing protein [Rarobacter incanus]